MNRVCVSILAATTLSGMTFAQSSTETRTGVSASQSTSVQSDRSGVQEQSQTRVQSSTQSALSGSAGKSTAGASNQLAEGTSFHTTLEKPVDARKCKPGDEVVAKNTENVKSNGQVIIPKGSKLVGHVTQVQAASKGQSSSQVGIAFDRVVLKNGSEVPMTASIQALAAAQGATSADLMGDTLQDGAMAGGGAVASGRGVTGGGGLVGGTTRAVGATGGGLVNTSANVASGAGARLNGSGAVLNGKGQLISSSRGVVGLNGLSLNSATAGAMEGSVITSQAGNVHLDSGTQMILQATAK